MSNLPYDVQIEYLESTGTQWIDTGYTPILGDSIHIEFQIDVPLSTTLMALYSAGTGTYQSIHLLASAVNGAYYKHFASGSAQEFSYYPNVGMWYNLNVNSNGNAEVNGYTSTSTPQHELDGNATTLWLFKRRNGTTPFIGKIRRFWIDNNGEKKIDCISVRVGNVGYLYDKVSETLLGNSGTGDFILGNDKALPNPFGFRRRLMVGGGLPYDAEVEYLESDGISFIDTGFYPNQNTGVVAELQFLTWNSWEIIFGCREASDSKEFTLQRFSPGNRIRAMYGSAGTGTNLPNVGTNKFDLYWNKRVMRVDNTTYTLASQTFTCPYTLYLYGLHSSTDEFYRARFWSCQIYDNDTLVRDYIPVRIGQTGYMYDKVSRNLYGNAAESGAFIIGNDINT